MSLINVTHTGSGEAERIRLLPAPQLTHIIDTQVNLQERIVYLDDIEPESGQWFRMVHDHLAAEAQDEPIHVMLNTPGGDVISMFAIHDIITSSDTPIYTYGYGQVCSAGVLILACADVRMVSQSCMWMSHEPWGFGGDSDLGLRAAKSRRKADDWMHLHWCDLMGRHTDHDAEWWGKKTEVEAEYWLLGGSAIVAAGVADKTMAPQTRD